MDALWYAITIDRCPWRQNLVELTCVILVGHLPAAIILCGLAIGHLIRWRAVICMARLKQAAALANYRSCIISCYARAIAEGLAAIERANKAAFRVSALVALQRRLIKTEIIDYNLIAQTVPSPR